MRKFSVSDVIDRGWNLMVQHGIVLIVIFVVIELIEQALSHAFSPAVDPDAIMEAVQSQDFQGLMEAYKVNPTATILIYILELVMMLGLIKLCIGFAKGSTASVSFDAWKQPFKVYVNYIGVSILYRIIVGIGLICCIIPGIYLAARLEFAEYRAIDHPEEGIMGNLGGSWNMTRGNVGNMILLVIASFFICMVGLLICCIGVFPAVILCYFAEITAYLILDGYFEHNDETVAE